MDNLSSPPGYGGRYAAKLMADEDQHNRQSIDYLLGLDPIERWPDDLGYPPSPEDYGNVCAWGLSHVESPTEEMLAALVHGALKHDDERVRFSCAEGVERIDPNLAKILYFIQTLDKDDHVRDNAFEALWHVDRDNLELARKACDRLLNDPDKFVRETAKRYKEHDDGEAVIHLGPRGGQYVVDKDGKKHYIKDKPSIR